MRFALMLLSFLVLPACASMEGVADKALHQPGLEGTRWGMVVSTLDGRELVAIRPDERFIPASNTKLFTVAAAFARLGDMSMPDPSMGTSVRIVPSLKGPPNVMLFGGGDPMLLDADDCVRDCLSDLVAMVAGNKITEVGTVIGNDMTFAYDPVPPGWSHDDIITRSGAPVSALTVNSNEASVVITPGPKPGDDATIVWRDQPELFVLHMNVTTVAADAEGGTDIRVQRAPGSLVVRVYGNIVLGESVTRPIAVEDPAYSAALRFRNLLERAGIHTNGKIEVEHRDPLVGEDYPEAMMENYEIARLLPPPLIEDVRFLTKQSQNLHAELLLHRLGLIEGGDGSREAGLKVVEATIGASGAPRQAWDLSDGSGMSVYNRVTPRMVTQFLRWTQMQGWGAAYRDVLPVGGVDGTLARRFKGTALEGRIFAKTGTLMNVNALSGFMLGKSGRMLVFSVFANDRPSEAGSALPAMDAALLAIAEAN